MSQLRLSASPESPAGRDGSRPGRSATGPGTTLELTHLLERWRRGDDEAIAEVLPHFYARLRRLAQHLMNQERSDHTLEATALVHEAYMRLLSLREQHWSDRDQFFTRCAFLMRNVLVDHARRHGARRRGGGLPHRALDAAGSGSAAGDSPDRETVLAVDEALAHLEEVDPQLAKLVLLRYFAGMTFPEIAALGDVSESTVKREWSVARAWLGARLHGTAGKTDGARP